MLMIAVGDRPEKVATDAFQPPPWTRHSPPWLALDAPLEADHLARRIDRGVEQLDLTPLWQSYSGRGTLPCRPDLMLKIALFEIQRGRASPAQWYLDTKENLALQWLGLGIRPARSVWYLFAWRLRPYLDGFNQQVLQQAHEQGCTAGQQASLDGTFVEAHASRHHLLNHEQLHKRLQVLHEVCAADTQGATAVEQPYWMAQTADTRQRQLQQYEQAQEQLQQRREENQQRIPSKRQEEKHVRISVTDPEAALGKDKLKVFRPLYNVQLLRDLDSPFILGYDTLARAADAGSLVPLLRRAEQLCGQRPPTVLVDSGYITALDWADAQELQVTLYGPWKENDYSATEVAPVKQLSKDAFVWEEAAGQYRCPQQQPLLLVGMQNRPRSLGRTEQLAIYRADAATCAACPLKAHCCPRSRSGRYLNRSEHEELMEAHRRKMGTPEAKALYKRRRQTVETSFGDAKQHRNYRRVHGRGLATAKAHTALTVLAHNLYELVKASWDAEPLRETT
jgi:transposase